MNPNKMTFLEVLDSFRARTVKFQLKDGTSRTIFVNEIENEEDDQPEIIFMGNTEKEDVWISDVVSAQAL